jgi:hypothetical protein
MFPLLKEQRDSVLIRPIGKTKPKRGDILLYQRASGLLVLHRLYRSKKDGFYFVGDNQTEIEGPLDASALIAKVIQIRRNGHLFSVKNPVYCLISRLWLLFRPVRPFISRPVGRFWRLLQRR